MAYEYLIYEAASGIATITLNRPKVMNALSLALLRELLQAATRAEDDPAIRALIVTGAGEKAFAAGADIAAFKEMGAAEALGFLEEVQAVMNRIERLKKPVLAAVNGYALGAGCELALSCDMIYAAETAKFGLPEVNLGIIPGAGGTQRLPRRVGGARAKELIYTGEMIDAQEAYRIGLVNRVVPLKDLMAEAVKLARLLASKSPTALQLCLEAVNRGCEMALDEGLEYEATLFAMAVASGDAQEGTQAFLEKRKPVWARAHQ